MISRQRQLKIFSSHLQSSIRELIETTNPKDRAKLCKEIAFYGRKITQTANDAAPHDPLKYALESRNSSGGGVCM